MPDLGVVPRRIALLIERIGDGLFAAAEEIHGPPGVDESHALEQDRRAIAHSMVDTEKDGRDPLRLIPSPSNDPLFIRLFEPSTPFVEAVTRNRRMSIVSAQNILAKPRSIEIG